jgi:hypothetical protein
LLEDQLEKSDISNFNKVMPIPLMFGPEKGDEDDDEDYEREKSKVSKKSKSGVDRLTTTSRGDDDDDEEDFMERAAEFGKNNKISGLI